MGLENSLILGRYRVLWPLDQTRRTRSYIARDEHREGSRAPVLIRHYMHDLGDEEQRGLRGLFDELSVLTHFRHPGVVPLLDFGTVDHCLVTVHAQRPGVDLAQLCDHFVRRHKPFPHELALFVVRRLLTTLSDCHERGVVHGRITLRSVYLPRSGEPQLTDFAVATLEDVASEAESELGFFQTKVSYAPPEVTRGASASARGDLYSLALLLYRLLAGANPFRGRSIPETLARVNRLAPAELVIPQWEDCGRVNEILRRALDKDPGGRYDDCAALEQELAGLQDGGDAAAASDLRTLIREHFSADWAQIARLTRARRTMPPELPRSAAASRLSHAPRRVSLPGDSQVPAFVSGLKSDQPVSVSVSDHALDRARTGRGERSRLSKKKRRERRGRTPTVLIPAVAIVFGLGLGRLLRPGDRDAPPPPLPAESTDEQIRLVEGSIRGVQSSLRSCLSPQETLRDGAKVQLEFGAAGTLEGVRLLPGDLSRTRLGACLLTTAWQTQATAPGALSLVIPLAASDE